MTGSQAKRASGLSVIALVLASGCARDAARIILAHGRTVSPSAQMARDARALARVGMDRTAVFNRLPRDGEVGIILADPRTDWVVLGRFGDAVSHVHDNCYTSAETRTVACDAAVFDERPDAILHQRATSGQRIAFARWILGHELGHIATHTAGFHSDPVTDLRRARDLAQQRREYAADCWMVQTLNEAMAKEDQIALESFAMDALNAHFRKPSRTGQRV
jgi:hypothetical protein